MKKLIGIIILAAMAATMSGCSKKPPAQQTQSKSFIKNGIGITVSEYDDRYAGFLNDANARLGTNVELFKLEKLADTAVRGCTVNHVCVKAIVDGDNIKALSATLPPYGSRMTARDMFAFFVAVSSAASPEVKDIKETADVINKLATEATKGGKAKEGHARTQFNGLTIDLYISNSSGVDLSIIKLPN